MLEKMSNEEMMNHFNEYENHLGQLGICPYIYEYCILNGSWMEHQYYLAEIWWGTKTFSVLKVDEIFSNCVTQDQDRREVLEARDKTVE